MYRIELANEEMNQSDFSAIPMWHLHLSKLIIDPTPADSGAVYSNCFRRRTNHQSIANIAKATNLMVAHSPTYLYSHTRNEIEQFNYMF